MSCAAGLMAIGGRCAQEESRPLLRHHVGPPSITPVGPFPTASLRWQMDPAQSPIQEPGAPSYPFTQFRYGSHCRSALVARRDLHRQWVNPRGTSPLGRGLWRMRMASARPRGISWRLESESTAIQRLQRSARPRCAVNAAPGARGAEGHGLLPGVAARAPDAPSHRIPPPGRARNGGHWQKHAGGAAQAGRAAGSHRAPLFQREASCVGLCWGWVPGAWAELASGDTARAHHALAFSIPLC